MRGRAKSGKTIDIVLNEEKFYFPGDSLQGTVIVHPKSPTKTNHIILRFTGQVVLSVKDKETITLFQRTQNIRASPGDKACILEAKQHSFAFNFEVPKGIELPSTMEFARKAKVRYVLTAIHDRPMVPESFCPKAQYVVPILEYLDIEAPQFRIPQEKTAKAPSLSSKQCQLKMSIPRTGFARGDIVTIHIIVTCSESLVVNKGLRLDLVRMADIRSGRHQFVKEDVLKTTEHDLNMIGPYNFSQAISCQMPIPTSTPPTIGYDGMTLRMYYQIRAKVRLTDIIEKPKTVTLELPIVVGTWPLADIPIDDDDDDDDDSLMMSVSDTDEPTLTTTTTTHESNNVFRMSGDITAFAIQQHKHVRSSAPHIALTPKEDTVDRSDSKSSKRSASSWRSNQSWDSQPLSRNTSLTTPDKLSSSSSFARTPSVTEPPVLPPPQPAPLPTNNNNNNNNNRNSFMYFDPHPTSNHYPQQQQQDPRRQATAFSISPPRSYGGPAPMRAGGIHDDSMVYPSVPPPPYTTPQNANVPNHVLQPLPTPPSVVGGPHHQPILDHASSSSLSLQQQQQQQQPTTMLHPGDTFMTDSSDDDSSDDDGDLLRIVRKKKKAEQKRQRQSMRL